MLFVTLGLLCSYVDAQHDVHNFRHIDMYLWYVFLLGSDPRVHHIAILGFLMTYGVFIPYNYMFQFNIKALSKMVDNKRAMNIVLII